MAITKESIQPKGDNIIVPPHEDRQAIGPGHLWDTKDAATFLNVKESTIRNWVHIGYIPHIKFRGAVRYKRDAIEQWIEGCAVSEGLPDTGKLASDILRSRNPRA